MVEKPSVRSPAVLCFCEDAFTAQGHHEEAIKFLSQLAGDTGCSFTASAFSSRPPQHPATKLFVIRKNTRTSFREIADHITAISSVAFPKDAIQQHPTNPTYAYLLCPNERLKDKALADLGMGHGKAFVALNGGRHIVQAAWTNSSKTQPQPQRQRQSPPTARQARTETTTTASTTASTTAEPKQQQQDKVTRTPVPVEVTYEVAAMERVLKTIITSVESLVTAIGKINEQVHALAQETARQRQKTADLEKEISQLKNEAKEKTKTVPEKGLKQDMVVLGEKFAAALQKMDTVLTTDKRGQERIANLESRIRTIEQTTSNLEEGVYAITRGFMALEDFVRGTEHFGIARDKNEGV